MLRQFGYATLRYVTISYNYHTVNHTLGFDDRQTGTHTNTIEGTWTHVTIFLNANNRQTNYIYYLDEYMLASLCCAVAIDPFTMFLLSSHKPTCRYTLRKHFSSLPCPYHVRNIVLTPCICHTTIDYLPLTVFYAHCPLTTHNFSCVVDEGEADSEAVYNLCLIFKIML